MTFHDISRRSLSCREAKNDKGHGSAPEYSPKPGEEWVEFNR